MEENSNQYLNELTQSEYKYGFFTDVEMDSAPKGLNEDIIRFISKKKNEPEFMLEFRLKAYNKWLTMKMPDWAHLKIPPIDFQDIIYYAAPKQVKKLGSLDEVDPELLKTFEKAGYSIERTEDHVGCGRRCGYRQCFGEDYLSEGVRGKRNYLLFHHRSRSKSS